MRAEPGRPWGTRWKGGAVELHDWLMFFHILGAIVWVGAVILTNAMLARASRAPNRAAVLRLSRELEWVGPRLIGPSALVVIGLGIWLVPVEEGLAFSQLWIWLSLALLAVSMGQNGIYSAPEGRRIARLAEERGAEDHEVGRRLSRLLWLGRLDILILMAVLWLMVFKPGGPAG
jgi:uncharacterized membrane protein